MSETTTSSRQKRKQPASLGQAGKVERQPQQSRSRQTRDSILLAAIRLFKDAGPASLSFAGIASSAGVSVGAVQFYFASKDAMIEAVISRILDDNLQAEVVLFQRLEAQCEDFDAYLRAYIDDYYNLLAQFNPNFVKSIDIIKQNPNLSVKGRDIGFKAEALAKAALRRALEVNGLIAVDDRIDAVYHIILSFTIRELNCPSGLPGSQDVLRRRDALREMCFAYLTGSNQTHSAVK
ncbi:TetR/AcrR family transcriptional regulator [Novosphingobium sp. KACC 22771]|uniref:TetR/AcrR family transcriptional regulator n=1 Tax=Novosphingobium sp. KACC 22771 TaxID=3025670 RepID=UPI002364FCDF|nr:TetR/AcrR family transcriptional regulator [Novosphingobium sp. KACC 22771]WDF75145.1 TetR/AcrR family transcriptional regulator [Novosphingobium sp. KACC 22771]